MVEQQTCSYCGAEKVGHTPPTGFTCNSTVFECNSYHYNPMNSWTKIYQSQSCMKRQIEQLTAEITKIKKSAIKLTNQLICDEREACSHIAWTHVCTDECKSDIDGSSCGIRIAEDIAVRGRVK